MKGYSMSGNWHQQSRFHWTALPFGFCPKNPARKSIVGEIRAARKHLESLLANAIEIENDRRWIPVRAEMGPLQTIGPGNRVEHEDEIDEMFEKM